MNAATPLVRTALEAQRFFVVEDLGDASRILLNDGSFGGGGEAAGIAIFESVAAADEWAYIASNKRRDGEILVKPFCEPLLQLVLKIPAPEMQLGLAAPRVRA